MPICCDKVIASTGVVPAAALGRPRKGQAKGKVSSVTPAKIHIAFIQPKLAIQICTNGAKIACPTDPPALIKPAANERFSAGKRCALAPIKIEKLPAPAPAADNKPIVIIKPICDSNCVVKKVPNANNNPPNTKTRPGPVRSAIAPKTG